MSKEKVRKYHFDVLELERLRKKAGISQETMASTLGISREHYNAIERGRLAAGSVLGKQIVRFIESEREKIALLDQPSKPIEPLQEAPAVAPPPATPVSAQPCLEDAIRYLVRDELNSMIARAVGSKALQELLAQLPRSGLPNHEAMRRVLLAALNLEMK